MRGRTAPGPTPARGEDGEGRTRRLGVGRFRLVVGLALGLAACGGGTDDMAPEAGGAANGMPDAGESGVAAVGDSLVLIANVHEAPLHFLPTDWPDLFHFRFADELLTLAPDASPQVRAFMAGVLESETRRVGTVDAGFDWLRRLDTTVLAYEDEADDVRWRLRQGQAWFALLPASEAGPLLEREGFQLVELARGFDPRRWNPPDAEGAEAAPEIPTDWLSRWAAEVRGRG